MIYNARPEAFQKKPLANGNSLGNTRIRICVGDAWRTATYVHASNDAFIGLISTRRHDSEPTAYLVTETSFVRVKNDLRFDWCWEDEEKRLGKNDGLKTYVSTSPLFPLSALPSSSSYPSHTLPPLPS